VGDDQAHGLDPAIARRAVDLLGDIFGHARNVAGPERTRGTSSPSSVSSAPEATTTASPASSRPAPITYRVRAVIQW
jgi:hypothetical protein